MLFFIGEQDQDDEQPAEAAAHPGGFPVPPMPVGGAVRGAARTLTFESRSPITEPTAATRSAAEEI